MPEPIECTLHRAEPRTIHVARAHQVRRELAVAGEDRVPEPEMWIEGFSETSLRHPSAVTAIKVELVRLALASIGDTGMNVNCHVTEKLTGLTGTIRDWK